jgi:hypothetical protein
MAAHEQSAASQRKETSMQAFDSRFISCEQALPCHETLIGAAHSCQGTRVGRLNGASWRSSQHSLGLTYSEVSGQWIYINAGLPLLATNSPTLILP